MNSMERLLRFARQAVQGVMSELTGQMNLVMEQVHSPMQQMVQQVVSGIWTGKGADAFVAEVTGLTIPGANRICDHITNTNRNIQRAIEVIDTADQAVTTAVNGLADQFASIF